MKFTILFINECCCCCCCCRCCRCRRTVSRHRHHCCYQNKFIDTSWMTVNTNMVIIIAPYNVADDHCVRLLPDSSNIDSSNTDNSKHAIEKGSNNSSITNTTEVTATVTAQCNNNSDSNSGSNSDSNSGNSNSDSNSRNITSDQLQ